MRIDITEKNMVWLVEHKMADTIVAEFHRKEAVIESLVSENARLQAEVERLTAQRAKLIESAEELFRFIGAELYGPIDHFEADWNAAKEGKPSAEAETRTFEERVKALNDASKGRWDGCPPSDEYIRQMRGEAKEGRPSV